MIIGVTLLHKQALVRVEPHTTLSALVLYMLIAHFASSFGGWLGLVADAVSQNSIWHKGSFSATNPHRWLWSIHLENHFFPKDRVGQAAPNFTMLTPSSDYGRVGVVDKEWPVPLFAICLGQTHFHSYSETIMWLRTKQAFALLRSSIMCLRGSRPYRCRTVSLEAIQLAPNEAGL